MVNTASVNSHFNSLHFNPPRPSGFVQHSLDSIAVSVFVVVLVEFDKYRIWDEQPCLKKVTVSHSDMQCPHHTTTNAFNAMPFYGNLRICADCITNQSMQYNAAAATISNGSDVVDRPTELICIWIQNTKAISDGSDGNIRWWWWSMSAPSDIDHHLSCLLIRWWWWSIQPCRRPQSFAWWSTFHQWLWW